ncbi:MAG: trehalose-6-phosphate synthase [Bryobacteraceae bacterium]|jgi:trehalose 6-phosphate synthase
MPLIVGVAAVSLACAFYETRAQSLGMQRDLQQRAIALGDSLASAVEPLVAEGSSGKLQTLLEQFKDLEAVAGIGAYDAAGAPLAATTGPAALLGRTPHAVSRALSKGWACGEMLTVADAPMQIAAIPLRSGAAVTGALAIVNDAGYIVARSRVLWRRALLGVAVQTVVIAGITLLWVRWSVWRPLRNMSQWLRDLRMGTASAAAAPAGDFEPLAREAAHLASSLSAARAAAQEEARLRDAAESTWTAERLRVFVEGRLGGARLFAVSNREPYEHRHEFGGIGVVTPPSGLVTALEPILRACEGTWVAQGAGDADRDAVDAGDRVRVPPDHPEYTLRRVWLTPEEQSGFYSGFANEGLWPLCHIAHTRPAFRAEDWRWYREVNRKFADALLEEIASEPDPIVLAQDYHFALLPAMIKEKRPDARVAIFWHIPWPNPEAFGICPWQRELLEGLLGADVIGFHLQAHCNNFLHTVDRTLESRIEWERFAVNRGGRLTLVRPFPISVATDQAEGPARGGELPHIERASLLAGLGVRASFMGVGVDRIDYTKGIPERFRGIEAFLENCPAYRSQWTFVQIASPSRTEIVRYHDLIREVEGEAERINRRFQTSEWKPIVLLKRQHSHREILPYYRAADFCLVTSLHDGMNLVAKEFVAARDDEHGVLILSRFAGACHELTDALLINPYDTGELADSIRRALEMEPRERLERMRRMRAVVRERNIYRWAANLIGELCAVRTEAEPALERVSAEVG